MSTEEVKVAKAGLMGLFKRPVKDCENLRDQTITVIPSPQELLYLRNCVNCKITIAGPCAKATIERCNHTEIEFKDRVLSGTLDIMYSKGVTVRIPAGHKLPTISVDNSNKCHLHLHDKSAISIIHTVWVEDVYVYMDPPHPPKYQLEHPIGEEGEFITKYDDSGNLCTSKAIREGSGYLCTVQEKEIADKKQADYDRKMTENVSKVVDSCLKTKNEANI